MRQFINFPNGVGKYKDFKINVNGINCAAYYPPGEQLIYVPVIADQTMAISLELAGSDQSSARYIAFAEAVNAALVAEPGGISVDVVETLNNVEVAGI
tara:strand:+ start:965 stop:1258 length:294 start_codon:yes stop_codon:yes gene_type:complete